MTGRVVECPIDEINRPRGRQQAKLRIPPTAGQVDHLFAGWREELATCRKFAPTARNYTACRLMSEVGLRVNEVCKLDLVQLARADPLRQPSDHLVLIAAREHPEPQRLTDLRPVGRQLG